LKAGAPAKRPADWHRASASAGRTQTALAYATDLIETICAVSASPGFPESDESNSGDGFLATALRQNDTPAIFDWMMDTLSFQGISDGVAAGYLSEHGNATWHWIEDDLAAGPSCPLLTAYWTYDGCHYDKTNASCSCPSHMDGCPVPRHRLRNGRLNQTAYSLYLFVRDIAGGDFPSWIDGQLDAVDAVPDAGLWAQEALVGPMRHIFGVADKVLTMALSSLLMADPEGRPRWFEVGSQLIVVDTLVHNFLVRSGILSRFQVAHGYGAACYRAGHCADILRQVSAMIDARRFNPSYPKDFPRFIQHALWRYCAANGLSVCNGNMIDDRQSCDNIACIIYSKCSKIALKSRISSV
jgi:hypothetical protein